MIFKIKNNSTTWIDNNKRISGTTCILNYFFFKLKLTRNQTKLILISKCKNKSDRREVNMVPLGNTFFSVDTFSKLSIRNRNISLHLKFYTLILRIFSTTLTIFIPKIWKTETKGFNTWLFFKYRKKHRKAIFWCISFVE